MSEKALNRESLKSLFSNGSRPDENNFGSLIDSMVNIVDDGTSSRRVLSFHEKNQDDLPAWRLELAQNGSKALEIVEPVSETEKQTRLFFEKGGKIGVGTEKPNTTLEVNGILGTSSRVGTYKMATVPADGSWHNIVTGLTGCSAFEVMAQVGKEKSGRYALLHAHALSTFGKSRNKIRTTQAHYGWWWNKLALRWTGSTFDYRLQLKTRSDYGTGQKIKFYVTKLWDNEILSLFNHL